MSARLLPGSFAKFDGVASEDFEALPTGVIAQLPRVVGTVGCILEIGTFYPRIGG
jgi:hypothetical protein